MQSSLSRPHSRCNLNCVPNSKKPISPSTSSSRGSDSLKSFLSLHPKRSHSTSPPSLLKPAYRCHSQNISSKPISFPAMKHSPLSANHHPRLRKCSQFHCVNSSNPSSADKISIRRLIEAIGEALLMSFPVWVALGCLMGLVKPSAFSWVRPELTILGLTVIMLGMGMTLTLDDLRGAFAMPRELLTGFVLQYSVMPLSGYFISKLLGLPSYSAAGLILVACCPGGTASNIVTYIARGNVALSVLMTAASTILAVVMTPFLTARLAGHYVDVDARGLVMSTMQVVLLPVLGGGFLNQYFRGLVRVVSPLMPPLAVATVAILCGNAIAQSSSVILASGRQVLLAVSLLHLSGFFFGYLLSRLLGVDESSSRTISIEVGMQNSSLGVVLACQHFGDPLAAVPCAVSSVCQSILGSTLAGIWRNSELNQHGVFERVDLKVKMKAMDTGYASE